MTKRRSKKKRSAPKDATPQPAGRQRFKVSSRFNARLEVLKTRDPQLRKGCRAAIKRLMESPGRGGSNLEPIQGTQGSYSARVNRNHRLILQKHEDSNGAFYLIVDVARHDDAY